MRQFKPGQLQTGSLYNISSSYALTASYTTNIPLTASYAINAETASYVNPLRQNVQITGSLYFPDNTHSIYFSGSGAASRLTWNDTDGTLELGLKGGIVQTEIGQGLVTRVVNKTTPNIDLSASNYQVVVVSGAQGQRLAVKLAQADNDANSAGTLGIIAEDIAKNQEGFIITVGLLKNRNTTGALQGETWSDGDILYLSPTTPGAITNIKPQAPQHTVIIGYVEYAHANNGKIYVKIDNGYELDELHNVRITTSSLSSGDLLVYSGSVWANTKQLTGSYGLTGSLTATTITASNAQIIGNVQILGTASISVLNVTYESASIIYSSGSNQFGDAANDTQTLWGTVDVKTGPLLVTGSVQSTGGFTGSISGSVTAPGSTTQVVFNNNGTLSAISDLVYSSSVIGIGTSSPSSNYKTNIVGSVGIIPTAGTFLSIGTSTQTSSFNEGTAILIDSRNITIGSFDNSIFPVGTRYNHTNNTPGLDSIEFIAGATTGTNGRVMFISASGNVGIGTSTPSYTLDVPNGSSRFFTVAVGNDGAGSAVLSTSGNYMFVAGNNNHDVILPGLFAARSGTGYGVGIQATQYPAVATSAILTLTSTTKGFLPPRTNLTSNISAPAQGLMTYVTASATEGLYYYNSGSYQNWTRILNNTGSQAISGSLLANDYIGVLGSSIGVRLYGSNNNSIPGYFQFLYNSGASTGGYLNYTYNGQFTFADTNVALGAKLGVRGQGATSATTTFLVQNSSTSASLTILDNNTVGIGRTPTASLDVAGTTRISGSFNTATSGSILTVIGSGSAQPIFTVQGSQGELFSITDSLSGSLFSVNDISGLPILEVFSDNTTLIGNYQDPMLITTTKLVTTASGAFTIYALPTASYDTAFFEYSIRSGSNARAGSIMAIQNSTSVNFTETTTTDFGSTSGLTLGVFVTGSSMILTGSATTSGWTIKTIVRSI